ncbi:MAG TPA: response regulator [Bryobacteraceae bacterium]|nr:response regulator [Bryobacteraceae bacterium]
MSSRILLIEDEPGLVLTISDLLTAEGHEVETAADGEAGLKKAAAREFSVVILDIMPAEANRFRCVP